MSFANKLDFLYISTELPMIIPVLARVIKRARARNYSWLTKVFLFDVVSWKVGPLRPTF